MLTLLTRPTNLPTWFLQLTSIYRPTPAVTAEWCGGCFEVRCKVSDAPWSLQPAIVIHFLRARSLPLVVFLAHAAATRAIPGVNSYGL